MRKRTVPEARDLIFCPSRYSIHISGTGTERRHYYYLSFSPHKEAACVPASAV